MDKQQEMNSELHLIIIWHSAKNHFEFILNTLKSQFMIMGVYEIFWDEESYVDNLTKFYSHSQFHLNQFRMKRMFQGKAKYCGIGSFYLIVFKDNLPVYADRSTSGGMRKVNTNIFDRKQEFRTLTGGGHKIHATDSQKETNKDITLLLGKNIHDYLESHTAWDNEIMSIRRNVTGVGGYGSLASFFYVLNSSLDYVVLRNFEDYPENYSSREHGDIDLLVNNLRLIQYLSGATKVYKRKHRVHYKLKINGSDVFFDFRHIGDEYYDKNWEEAILNNRILMDKSFYIPDESNHYYSLLYHALLHKPFLSQSYEEKLLRKSSPVNHENSNSKSGGVLFQDLDKFMKEHGFRYVIPKDISVYFNKNNIKPSTMLSFSIRRSIRQLIVDFRLNLAKFIRRR